MLHKSIIILWVAFCLAGCDLNLTDLGPDFDDDLLDIDTEWTTDESQDTESDTDSDDTESAIDTDSGIDTATEEDSDSDSDKPQYMIIVTELVDPVSKGWTTLGYDDGALDTYQVFAQFNEPGIIVAAVGDGAEDEIDFTLTSGDGSFFNSAVGENRPTSSAMFSYSEDLRWDTFITIGQEIVPSSGTPITGMGPGLSNQVQLFAGNVTLENTGWYVMGLPAVASSGDDGRVLLGQFTVAEGVEVSGDNWRVSANDQGSVINTVSGSWSTAD